MSSILSGESDGIVPKGMQPNNLAPNCNALSKKADQVITPICETQPTHVYASPGRPSLIPTLPCRALGWGRKAWVQRGPSRRQ